MAVGEILFAKSNARTPKETHYEKALENHSCR